MLPVANREETIEETHFQFSDSRCKLHHNSHHLFAWITWCGSPDLADLNHASDNAPHSGVGTVAG